MKRTKRTELKEPTVGMMNSINYGDEMVIAGTNYKGRNPQYVNGVKTQKGIPFVNTDKLKI